MLIHIPFTERSVFIEFVPAMIKRGVNVYKSKCRKYIDSIYFKSIWFFGLYISYNDYNYNNVVHVILDSRNTFRRTETSDQLVALSNQLKETVIAADGYSRKWRKSPVSFGSEVAEIDDNGNEHYRFYITAKKNWLERNGYGPLVPKEYFNDYCEDIDKNKDKFPKYRRFMREVIFV